MNQSVFREQAERYRNQKEDPDMEPGYFRRMAAMYEALAILDESGTIGAALDTGIFNDAIRAYCSRACKRAGLEEETRAEVLKGLTSALDIYTAAEAIQAAQE